VSFEPRSHPVDVLPLKRGLIETCFCNHVIRQGVQARWVQNLKCFTSYLTERFAFGNAAIGKKPKYLAGLWQICVTYDAPSIYLLFCGGPGLIAVSPHVINQALNQIVVQFLVTVMNEAQEVDKHDPFTQLAKPVNGVIAHQGSVVFDVLVGDFQMRQQFLGNVIKGAHPIAAPNLAFDFVIAEVPGIALEKSNFVESLRISEQGF
jgi:hypothetical protein